MADHKPDCGCKPCKDRQAAEAHRKAAAELEQARRDAAWMQVMGQGGPDAVLALARQHGDPERARRLLEAGGFPVAEIMDRHRAEAPHGLPLHVARQLGQPEAVEALRVHGTWAQRARARELAEEERAARAAEKPAGYDPRVMWRTRGGGLVTDGQAPVMGASIGANGAPVQRSQIHNDVAELGT